MRASDVRRPNKEHGGLGWAGSPIGLAPLAFFDLETTGLRPDRGAEITEIALVSREQPLLHWSVEDVEGAPLEAVLPLLLEHLDAKIVVGHHLSFDFRFLTYEARRRGLTLPRFQFIDTLGLARRRLSAAQTVQLGALLRRFGITPEEPLHHALTDARATRALFRRLVEEGGLQTLADAGARPLTWTAP